MPSALLWDGLVIFALWARKLTFVCRIWYRILFPGCLEQLISCGMTEQPEQVQRAFDEADLVCCVDFSSEGRLDEMDHVLLGCKTQRVIIDHHLAPNLEAKLLVSQPHASSASDLVFRVVWQLGGFHRWIRPGLPASIAA